MPDLLLEIGTEEIPARMIDAAREELAKRIGDLLHRERLSVAPAPPPAVSRTPSSAFSSATAQSFSTPRRLAVLVRNVLASQPDAEQTVNGPAVKVAFKDGAPTPAAHAFAKRVNQPMSELKTITTPKGEYLTATITERGRAAAAVLAEALPKEIAGIYWPKSMYWRAGKPERFVRPLHWIVALLDSEIIPFEFAGVRSGNRTRGHRILSSGDLTVTAAADYETIMQQGSVVADPGKRRAIVEQLLAQAGVVTGLNVSSDPALTEDVVNLVESPGIAIGAFGEEILVLPEEVLVTVMRDHQKYFALRDDQGKLAPRFIAILNNGSDPGAPSSRSEGGNDLIVHGNERVLRARFNDARFFWNTDQKLPLNDRTELLRAVTFQKDLGSYAEKSVRMAKLVDWLAAQVSATGRAIDSAAAITAAQLAKCDLTTELVKEFTELQGVIGGLYARAQGHAENVWTAIYDQYKPAAIDADAPRNLEGALVAVADKADSIAGMFALGLIPSGSKDPFALRRQANGIVKILAAHDLSISVSALMQQAFAAYDGSDAIEKFRNTDYAASVALFFRERTEFYLREQEGIAYDVVNAVLAAGYDNIPDTILRARAVSKVRGSEDFAAIATSFKRIKNILRQATEKGFAVADHVDANALPEPQEQQLATEVAAISKAVHDAQQRFAYREALVAIAGLRPALDAFFDKVMVMAEDAALRANRLALLAQTLAEFTTLADFSEIIIAEK